MLSYEPAPEVAEVAAGLIIQHHPNLADAPIVYLFVDPAPTQNGRTVIGRARVVKGLNAFLVAMAAGEVEAIPEPVDDDEEEADAPDYSFFVMEVSRDHWRRAEEGWRRALVDHELCHFKVDDKDRLKIRAHDIEEFNGVVQRHGIWSEDLERFAGTCTAVPA